MKTLISNELLQHTNEDVKILDTTCLTELQELIHQMPWGTNKDFSYKLCFVSLIYLFILHLLLLWHADYSTIDIVPHR